MILHCTDCNETFYAPYRCKICPICGKQSITDGDYSIYEAQRESPFNPGSASKCSSVLLSDYQCTCEDFDRLRYTLFEKSKPSTALKQQLIQIENLMKYLGEAMESLDELVREEGHHLPSEKG